MMAYRRGARKRRNRRSGGLRINGFDSVMLVGATVTLTGSCKRGEEVTVTIGGEAFGSDVSTTDGLWSVTAAVPSVEGDDVEIAVTSDTQSITATVAYVLDVQVAAFVAGLGETYFAPPNEDRITQWTSQINGHTAIQGTLDSAPVAGADAVEFDNSNDYLVNNTIGDAYAGSGVIWSATVFLASPPAKGVWTFDASPPDGLGELSLSVTAASALALRANDSSGDAVSTSFTEKYGTVHVFVGSLDGTTMAGWLDGSLVGTDTISSAVNLSGLALTLGQFYLPAGYSLHGGIYAALFGTTLTTTQRQRIEAAMALKYGITLP